MQQEATDIVKKDAMETAAVYKRFNFDKELEGWGTRRCFRETAHPSAPVFGTMTWLALHSHG